MNQNEAISLIKRIAIQENIDANLLQAISEHESSYDPNAIRFEPGWRYFVSARDFADKNYLSCETEQTLQACSFGLGQIMGSVAREQGFQGRLTRLISEPELALTYAARHLHKFIQLYPTKEDAISAYNQGGNYKTPAGTYKNEQYVDAVSTILRKLNALI